MGHAERRDSVAGQHGIDGKAHFEPDKGPYQRDQFAQQRSVRQQPLEISKVERSDPKHDPRLLVPGAHTGSRIEAELANAPDAPLDRLPVVHAAEVVGMHEKPVEALSGSISRCSPRSISWRATSAGWK